MSACRFSIAQFQTTISLTEQCQCTAFMGPTPVYLSDTSYTWTSGLVPQEGVASQVWCLVPFPVCVNMTANDWTETAHPCLAYRYTVNTQWRASKFDVRFTSYCCSFCCSVPRRCAVMVQQAPANPGYTNVTHCRINFLPNKFSLPCLLHIRLVGNWYAQLLLLTVPL